MKKIVFALVLLLGLGLLFYFLEPLLEKIDKR